MKSKRLLKEWRFGTGVSNECLQEGKKVTIPHTWNIETGLEEYWGPGWYEYMLTVPNEWMGKRVRLKFGAVYHSAEIYVNDMKVGEHKQSGYTSFIVEITEALVWGEKNIVRVKADNTFSDELLPYKRCFDWSNDGGIIRDVELLVSGKVIIERIQIQAKPIITNYNTRQLSGSGVWGADIHLDIGEDHSYNLEWELFLGIDDQLTSVLKGETYVASEKVIVPATVLDALNYWHFDQPMLYTLKVKVKSGGNIICEEEEVFGFREFLAKGNAYYLNGEKVRLCGTEWMPGSNPDYGSAEPAQQLEKMLILLKESNCIFTRFHWQQDAFVYDWCDRHGMLVQEEIPFWGKDLPDESTDERYLNIFKGQMLEMVESHGNHPSIIGWGVGNELHAQSEHTLQYIRDAVAYTHTLDGTRQANYVSNTIFENPSIDGTKEGDVLMFNDYIGTWHGPLDQYKELKRIVKSNPDKPVVSTEFGLCEPAFEGGDERRIEIFLEKMSAYRSFEAVAGTINFCLNDYRTQLGEDGKGKFRQRIHGSTDLYGEKKPSYNIVQRECAPYTLDFQDECITIECRSDLPCYSMMGYYSELYNHEGDLVETFEVPDLKPGEGFSYRMISCNNKSAKVFRSNGDLSGAFCLEQVTRI